MTPARLTFVLVVLATSCRAGSSTPPQDRAPLTPAAAPAGGARSSAGPPGRPGCRKNFAGFDDDGDGLVSREEFLARPHAAPEPLAVFDARDGNRDGELTESEFCSGWHAGPAMRPRQRERRPASGRMMTTRCQAHFDEFDDDGDGWITAEEFARWPHARGDASVLFEARDRNGDGKVTRDELCSGWR